MKLNLLCGLLVKQGFTKVLIGDWNQPIKSWYGSWDEDSLGRLDKKGEKTFLSIKVPQAEKKLPDGKKKLSFWGDWLEVGEVK